MIPIHVRTIGCGTFCDCGLQQIDFSANSELQIIGTDAFRGSQIESLTIPSSITNLQEGWCSYLEKLIKINIFQSNKNYTLYQDKFILGKSSQEKENFNVLLFSFRNVEKVIIPDFIEVIGPYAFELCTKLKYIEISPNSKLKEIKNDAFSNSKIKEIFIPSTVSKIGYRAFLKCTNLTKVKILPNSNLQSIESYTFHNSNIKEIFIPPHVTEICDSAFLFCMNLENVEISEDSQLRKIGNESFLFSGIRQIKIPKNVNQICQKAFENCEKLQIVEFDENSQITNALKNNIDTFKNNIESLIIMIPKNSDY